ncbi:HET domain-containing protein [Rutstroemia sp. NJR-2017a WRK4]|nr:HET domain-containing protein [Rutstroemia sp. NJR-2017a WRK4]
MRRELVLVVYGIPGKLHYVVPRFNSCFFFFGCALKYCTKERLSGELPSIAQWPVSTSPEHWAGAGKAWLSTCISSHEITNRRTLTFESLNEVDSFYVTLSYCWGGPQEIALTEETIAEKQKGFKIASLPATLKYAIIVTRELGIKYIWIDSLCIIQYSKDNVLRELPCMAGYYKNSHLTISASTSKCTTPFLSSDGLCDKHPGNWIRKDLVPLGLWMSPRVGTRYSKNIVDWVLVLKGHPYFLFWEPIYKRGWAFQQRVLSPRNLLFGGRLVWQCHSTQDALGGVTDWDDDASNVDHRMIGRLLLNAQNDKKQQESPAGAETANKEQYDVWYKSVEEYKRRELSVSNNKLPAISALAQIFQNLTGDEYLAGI